MGSMTKVCCSSFHSSPMNPSFLLFQVLKPFLEDSKYQSLLPLFVGHNLLLVSEEPKVKEMVRILKGVPFLPLLGERAPLPVAVGWRGAGGVEGSRCCGSLVQVSETVDILGGDVLSQMGPESIAPFVEGCLCHSNTCVGSLPCVTSALGRRLGEGETPTWERKFRHSESSSGEWGSRCWNPHRDT